MRVSAAAFILMLSVTAPLHSQPILAEPTYQADASQPVERWYVLDSKWGFVSRFNLAVADRLRHCGSDGASELAALLDIAPNRFGENSRAALDMLRRCSDAGGGDGGSVDKKQWLTLTSNSDLPTVLEKTRAIAFRGAGLASDYDSAFWNADAPLSAGEDPKEIFTWGPAKATVVDGCFIQKIVRTLSLDPAGAEALKISFAEIPAGLELLLTSNCASAAADFSKLGNDPEMRDAFRRAFVRLGADRGARAAYDSVYFGPNGPWSRRMNAYYEVFQQSGRKPTEVDFALLLELARGNPMLNEAQIKGRVEAVRAAGPRPVDVRLALVDGLQLVKPAAQQYNRGRLMSYIIGPIAESKVPPSDLAAWATHSRIKAGDVGLTDAAYLPCEIMPSIPQCNKGAVR